MFPGRENSARGQKLFSLWIKRLTLSGNLERIVYFRMLSESEITCIEQINVYKPRNTKDYVNNNIFLNAFSCVSCESNRIGFFHLFYVLPRPRVVGSRETWCP